MKKTASQEKRDRQGLRTAETRIQVMNYDDSNARREILILFVFTNF